MKTVKKRCGNMADWKNDDPDGITPKNGLPGESYRVLILNVKKC